MYNDHIGMGYVSVREGEPCAATLHRNIFWPVTVPSWRKAAIPFHGRRYSPHAQERVERLAMLIWMGLA
jgi:hypothetical protein